MEQPHPASERSEAPVAIRAAGPQDFERITALLAELGGGRPPLPTQLAVRALVRAVYEEHLARHAAGRAFLYVATMDDIIVGFISADVRARLNQPTPEVWIADLMITETARGRGVGKALLARVVEEARRTGAHRVSLESGHWRPDAHRFYLREGFANQALHFGLDLPREL